MRDTKLAPTAPRGVSLRCKPGRADTRRHPAQRQVADSHSVVSVLPGAVWDQASSLARAQRERPWNIAQIWS